jgi:hypothetical protein
VEYEFDIGADWSLAPAFYFDIVEDETKEVFGVAIGLSFLRDWNISQLIL